jgi:predicted nucleic acid-binding protein
MIAVDTSSFVAFFEGENAPDVHVITSAISDGRLCLPPAVVTELLSYPKAGPALEPLILPLTQLATSEGYWARAGETRRRVLAHGFKARVADALIAQSCIDHGVPLISRDKDFRHFAKHCGLVLA